MAVSWLVLEDDSAGADTITPLLAALHTATAAKYSGTVAQSIRTSEYDPNVLMVAVNITDTERTGSLAAIARDQEGIGIFLEEMANITEHQRWGFNHVGDANPATGAVRKTYYLRSNHTQETVGGAITTRTNGTTGRNFADAVFSQTLDGLAGLPANNFDIVICGDLFYAAGAAHSSTPVKSFDVKQGCRVFFDKVGHRGCLFGAMLISDAYGTWTDEGGDVYSITITGVNAAGPSTSPRHYWARDKMPGDYGKLLTYAASQAEMEANEDYIWSSNYNNGGTVYVHMPAGETPNNRIFMGTANLEQGPMPRVSGTHPTGVEFYAEKWLLNQRVDEANFYDGATWFKGQGYVKTSTGQTQPGMTRKGGMYGLRIIDGTSQITGPTIFGRVFSECSRGGFYGGFGDPTKGVTGAYFEDCESYDIGGVNPTQSSNDGHADGVQNGPFTNATYRGRYWAIRCGAPVNFYSLEADNNPAANVRLGDDFSGLDWDTDDTILQDHSEFWPAGQIGSSSADVGFHLSGDNNAMANHNGSVIKMTGTITGLKHGFRFKHPYQVTLTSHTVGGLSVEKGSYPNADSSGVVLKIGPIVETVTLSGSSGNWAVGDNLEDPNSAGAAAGTITRIVGANPTVTLEFRRTAEAAATAFADTQTVNNLDDTGTGTANGNSSQLGRSGGNADISNIRFESDLDKFIESDISSTPTSNAAVPYTNGMHIKSNNNVFVGDTTGKFATTLHGAQDLPGWRTNSASDNVHDPDSTNPSS